MVQIQSLSGLMKMKRYAKHLSVDGDSENLHRTTDKRDVAVLKTLDKVCV